MRLLVASVSTVVHLVANLPLADAATVPTLELVRGTRGRCGGATWGREGGGGDTAMVTEDAKFIFCFLRTKKGQEEAEGKKKNVRK